MAICALCSCSQKYLGENKPKLTGTFIHFYYQIFLKNFSFFQKEVSSWSRSSTKEYNNKIFEESNNKNREALENLREIKASERSINKMLVFSFLMYFICRFRELCAYLYLATPFYATIFIYTSAPLMLINIIHYLYVISYSLNIFKLNHMFRDLFNNVLYSIYYKYSIYFNIFLMISLYLL